MKKKYSNGNTANNNEVKDQKKLTLQELKELVAIKNSLVSRVKEVDPDVSRSIIFKYCSTDIRSLWLRAIALSKK